MKKNFRLVMLFTVLSVAKLIGQVGISTNNPLATLHVDGAKDNPNMGIPNSAQESNDAVVTSTGQLGVGIIKPTTKFQVVANTANANRFTLIDAPTGTNQYVTLALRNTSPLATGNYSILGFTNSGPASGGANWGLGTIRTGAVSASGSEEEFFIANSTGVAYNERMRINTIGNVGIGTSSPNPSAILELSSTTKGFLPTRLTTAQRDAITPKPAGLMIYNTDTNCMEYWNTTMWVGNCAAPSGTNTITNCTSGALNGTYVQGTPMNAGNTVTITVNVAQTGAWSITSNTVNGVIWSGSGTFTSTGVQNVTLTASGTPTNSGTFDYTFNLGSSSCTRSITFNGNTPSSMCQFGPDDLPNNSFVTSNGIQISVSATHTGDKGVNTTGWYGCGPAGAANAVYMSNFWLFGLKNGVHTSTTTTYSFSRPISNAEVSMSELDVNQSVTITAQDVNGNNVSVVLTKIKDCISSNNTVSGNTVTATSGRNTSLSIRVGGAYYRKITVVHNGVSGSYRPETNDATAANLTLCNAVAQ